MITRPSPDEAAHADYGASSMERWTSCLGSTRLCEGLQSADTEWSDEGTIAHGLMQHCLMWRERSAVNFVGVIVEPVQGRRFGPISTETARNVQVILDYVYDILDRYPDAQLSVEYRGEIPSQAVPGRMWGTVDVKIYVPAIRWLFIIDYKHGVGIFVDGEDNKQLKFYGLAALWECMRNDQAVAGITLAIVQPRAISSAGGIRDAHVSPADLFAFHAYAEAAAYASLQPNAPLVPSTDPHGGYCRWCPAGAAGRCPVLERTAVAVVGTVTALREITKASLPDPKTLSFERMNYVLDMRQLLVAWMKSVYECAIGYARGGNAFPGRKLVLASARRQWDVTTHRETDIAAQLAIWTGRTLDEVYPRSLIGITEAENALVDVFRQVVVKEAGENKSSFVGRQNAASEAARNVLALLTLKRPTGGVELVPMSDPRPAIGADVFFGGVNMEGLT